MSGTVHAAVGYAMPGTVGYASIRNATSGTKAGYAGTRSMVERASPRTVRESCACFRSIDEVP
eukprot:186160-Rhodomonas_salina.1